MTLIVVSGAIANKLSQGGEAWVRLSYLLGLRRLGYEVYFIEQIDESVCLNDAGQPVPLECSANRTCFNDVMSAFGLEGQAALISTSGGDAAQIPRALWDIADRAAALVNVSGHLTIESLFRRFRRKVFIDIDPGYTQFWHAMGESGAKLEGHDLYFTIGENIGSAICPIPLGGIAWRTTRPPVVLDQWPSQPPTPPPLRFTTIANWRGSYGPVQMGTQTYGLKVHEFRKYLELPACVPQRFEIALNIHPGDARDLAALKSNGWAVQDPQPTSATPQLFRNYIQQSGAEFSVAQGIYVDTASGWFSDRTVRYLASGKPALVQETGFSSNLPSGLGLVPFRTMEEAIAGAESIAADYEAHCRAARAIADEFFDSDRVLGKLMREIGVAP